jgi:hypothetical protein
MLFKMTEFAKASLLFVSSCMHINGTGSGGILRGADLLTSAACVSWATCAPRTLQTRVATLPPTSRTRWLPRSPSMVNATGMPSRRRQASRGRAGGCCARGGGCRSERSRRRRGTRRSTPSSWRRRGGSWTRRPRAARSSGWCDFTLGPRHLDATATAVTGPGLAMPAAWPAPFWFTRHPFPASGSRSRGDVTKLSTGGGACDGPRHQLGRVSAAV